MEQMYVISRMEEALTAPLVPESKLKRRLTSIVAKTRLKYQDRTILIEDAAIDILLHGEAVPPAKGKEEMK